MVEGRERIEKESRERIEIERKETKRNRLRATINHQCFFL